MHHARLFLQGSQRRRGTEGCKQPAVWPSRGSPSLPRRLTMANDGRRSGEGSRRARSPAQHRHPTLGKTGDALSLSWRAGPHRQRNIKLGLIRGKKNDIFLSRPPMPCQTSAAPAQP